MSTQTLETVTKVMAKLNGKSIKLDFDPAEEPQTIRTVLPFQMKSINDDDRTIEFIGSTATKDRYGDEIVQAGWELGNFTKNPVVPWGHDYSQPPVAQAVEVGLRDGNLFFKAKFPTIAELSSDPDHPSDWALFVDAIYNSYKGGYLRAFSVGFIPLEYDGNWQDGYTFTKCELLEVSCVTVPANPEALVLAFKEGVLTENHKRAMLKQAEKLMQTLTDDTSSPINKGMNDETKAYIDEQFKVLADSIAEIKAAVVTKTEDDAEEAPDDPANPPEPADGGTDGDDVDEEALRSMVRSGLRESLGIIE